MTWTPPSSSTPTPELFLPSGMLPGGPGTVKALINIVGTSGVGKSHLGRQLILDPDYGPDEVLFLMHEDATATYGPEAKHVRKVTTFDSALQVMEELAIASKQGRRLPKVLFYDSLTGATDYFQSDKEENPNLVAERVDGKLTGEMVRDKRSEYGDMGRAAQRCYLLLRDRINMDVVVLITSYEDRTSPIPEIACEGRVIPKNITRWSSCTLYMKAVEGKDDPAAVAEFIRTEGLTPNRTYGRGPTGELDGTFISRFFVTQNTGEITAKGHRNLNIKERAILPDVLRKIHGVTKPQEGKIQ